MRLIWLLLLIFQAVYAGDKNVNSTKQYLDLNNSKDKAFIWENLFIKLNRVVEATQKFEQNFESINKRFDELSKRQNEQERNLSIKPLDIGNINGAPKSQWTTILRRQDGSVDFNRNWNHYKNGFGNPDADFFIGLEMLHRLTSKGRPQELLVVLVDYENVTRFARYDKFRIGSEAEKYAITELGTYSGDAGDGMGVHRGKKFTTFDQDNNAGNIRDCPQTFKGGWWFHDPCYSGHLHGPYRTKENSRTWGVSWDPWRKWNVSLKYAAMMIRDKM
ncbi:ficolin-2-like [Musca vetustissima]|uniref:ficolin-2-like n=1 Tax=Musca vetustissima TaxID=27455 RepID=UPI002AB60AE9|nr:ficolin-2-like [Musca vetustissima]